MLRFIYLRIRYARMVERSCCSLSLSTTSSLPSAPRGCCSCPLATAPAPLAVAWSSRSTLLRFSWRVVLRSSDPLILLLLRRVEELIDPMHSFLTSRLIKRRELLKLLYWCPEMQRTLQLLILKCTFEIGTNL